MIDRAEQLVSLLIERRVTLATAESCTGGMIAAAITSIPGASKAFWGGVVTYSNESKEAFLSVAPSTLETHGAVSAETAEEMAEGMLRASGADIAVSVSGIAGPDGGGYEKPVGLVWFGIAARGVSTKSESRRFKGDRSQVRESACEHAMSMVMHNLADGGARRGKDGNGSVRA